MEQEEQAKIRKNCTRLVIFCLPECFNRNQEKSFHFFRNAMYHAVSLFADLTYKTGGVCIPPPVFRGCEEARCPAGFGAGILLGQTAKGANPRHLPCRLIPLPVSGRSGVSWNSSLSPDGDATPAGVCLHAPECVRGAELVLQKKFSR